MSLKFGNQISAHVECANDILLGSWIYLTYDFLCALLYDNNGKSNGRRNKRKSKKYFFSLSLSFFALVIAIVVILIGKGRGC